MDRKKVMEKPYIKRSISKTVRSQYKCFLEENPESPKGFERGLEPLRIVGTTDSSGQLMYLMLWKGSDFVDEVPAEVAHNRCPQLVIRFYEERLVWASKGEGKGKSKDN